MRNSIKRRKIKILMKKKSISSSSMMKRGDSRKTFGFSITQLGSRRKKPSPKS